MEFKRKLNLEGLLRKKSFFLFGPRSTGKSTLIHQKLGAHALIIDLLESDLYLRLLQHPQELENFVLGVAPKQHYIVIDEIQKVPELLNEVHRLIEKHKIRFLLTGSSARKLKNQNTNMLAGRAWMAHLFPLSWCEISSFNLQRYLQYGGLPHVYLSQAPEEELRAYVQTYLYEEIKAEGLVRKIPAFARFLEVAALGNGQLLNFTEIGNDANMAPSTIREYYSVLEDTLLGYLLHPWTKSKKRKAIQTAKFYFFDIGVVHALTKAIALDRHSDKYGNAFEHFIGMELRAYLDYSRKFDDLCFWRSINGQEVDYVVGQHTAIEIKATTKVTEKHLKGLKALAEEGVFREFLLVSQDPRSQKIGEIRCLPWEIFLKNLWEGSLFEKGLG
ncbi:MAG: ATP-binding protein [Deltaproteobacteria bacterium]|nr:ATP-binding protein [Deltaproteobacteria bacterium]